MGVNPSRAIAKKTVLMGSVEFANTTKKPTPKFARGRPKPDPDATKSGGSRGRDPAKVGP
jgi:hypothetical protein